jgi:cytochrome P450
MYCPERREGWPADDLLTTLIDAARDPDGKLDLANAVSLATTFFLAGHKTASHYATTRAAGGPSAAPRAARARP